MLGQPLLMHSTINRYLQKFKWRSPIKLLPIKLLPSKRLPLNNLRQGFSTQLLLLGVISSFFLSIPAKSIIARTNQPQAQGILVLGGGSDREVYAAHFAKDHPDLPVWLSTGKSSAQATQNFQTANIDLHRVHLDYRAVDTVTNFTTLVDDFESQNIKHVYLITSDFHLPRATAIASIVFGSRGITFTTIGVPAARTKEPRIKILRDSLRGLVWVLTGKTGASLNPRQWKHFG